MNDPTVPVARLFPSGGATGGVAFLRRMAPGSLAAPMRGRPVALLVGIALLVSSDGGAVAASAQVDDPRARAEEADAGREEAYRIVEAAVADRERVEADLFASLEGYRRSAASLAQASADLELVAGSLAFAEATARQVEEELETQAVTAYVEAVAVPGAFVLDITTAEQVLVVDQALEAGNRDALSRLDELLARRRELEALRAVHAAEQEEVARLTLLLGEESDRLQLLLAEADAALAEAFRRAEAADAAHREALDDLARVRAAEAEDRRQARGEEPPVTTSTTPPGEGAAETTSTTGATTPPPPADPTTTTAATTTTVPEPGEAEREEEKEEEAALSVGASTRRWLPVVRAHFPGDLVEDALVIIECESGGDPEAVNPYSGAAGLFQFLPGTWAVASVKAGVGDSSPLDPEANVAAASWLAEYYRARGLEPWHPWHCSRYL